MSISYFAEELLGFKSRKVRQEATKAMVGLFKLTAKQNSFKNITSLLQKMMSGNNKLKKYNVACLLSEAAKFVTEDGFKKVSELVQT